METEHRIYVSNSDDIAQLEDGEVDLVVTSPPYPMIEMWDGLFADLNSEINGRLQEGDGEGAFELMHSELQKTWKEINRVLTPGGIACINIGDATRKVDGSFQVYPNHAEVINNFRDLGFQPLPDILWRKPTNSAAKFMGSGMLPPNAYATLEHEYILIFRNGSSQREFEPGSPRRYNSAYFWEERNKWFSDVWMDIRGTLQELNQNELRERSAAFPLELPYRLISMYSAYGDTVLDPFWGTGTTSMAAMATARNSIGCEIKEEFATLFDERVDRIKDISWETARGRIQRHREFAKQRLDEQKEMKYDAIEYDFPVTTKQERKIRFHAIDNIHETQEGYVAQHVPVEERRYQAKKTVSRSGSGPSQSTFRSDFS